ncbi:MAG: PEP-CTERM sorting domain-containing protein [Candidatus Schekmanbacteria bacterium]|nr:PEP-CTERM sorting domain-containing protein [Candidatus Schekmanbacteria bacterium]
MKKFNISILLILLIIIFAATNSFATPIEFSFSEASGRSASASIDVIGGQLVIVLSNTSTGAPDTNAANSLLTALYFDLPDSASITGGTVLISPESYTENFKTKTGGAISLTGGADVSSEYGFGNNGDEILTAQLPAGDPAIEHVNFFSAMQTHTTPFLMIPPGTNLDGTINLDGPQGGLTNNAVDLGGLGAICNSVTANLNIMGVDLNNPESASSTLSYIFQDGITFEFGSDIYFYSTTYIPPVPEPSTMLMVLLGLIGLGAKGYISRKH